MSSLSLSLSLQNSWRLLSTTTTTSGAARALASPPPVASSGANGVVGCRASTSHDMMQANRPPPSSTAADKWYEEAVHFLTGERNITDSLGRAQLRDSLAPVAPFFIILYALLVVGGAGANFAVLFTVTRGWVRGGAGRDSTCGYVANLALADLVKCVFVLPMTLAILLVRNWVFGSFACYFVPMLQVI